MKLLIIDDEKRTREGILQAIDWEALDISEVFLADDGQRGLDMARKYHPEIILSDIRMPRMDGIVMAQRIHELLPETCIIFMSGYSDKEYLKAAITLKAIRYVEKPIDVQEIREAVREAGHTIAMQQHTKRTEMIHYNETRRKLALYLIQERTLSQKDVALAVDTLGLPDKGSVYFTTFLLYIKAPIPAIDNDFMNSFFQEFSGMAKAYRLQEFHAVKSEHVIVFHLYGSESPSGQTLTRMYIFVREYFLEDYLFFIAPGTTVCGIEQICQSYNNAVVLLQTSFFKDYNVILHMEETVSETRLLQDQLGSFSQALVARDKAAALAVADTLYIDLKHASNLLPSQVKDIYYKYFYQLDTCMIKNHVPSLLENDANPSLWESISACQTLHELDLLLKNGLEQLFLNMEKLRDESSAIFLIKDFIHKNYGNETLSIKDISEHVFLSPSYMCTQFKSETGKTINQYMTEYRLEIAKQMLSDPRYRIADISAKVGYSDGNYFGKLFKKVTGLSPSEYREKVLL